MKRTLQIHIDANRVTCGKCEHVRDTRYHDLAYCRLLSRDLKVHPDDGAFRCAPCLAAEVKK